MRSLDVLENTCWRPLSYSYKLENLCINYSTIDCCMSFQTQFAMKHDSGQSLRVKYILMVSRFDTKQGKISIARRGPILCNAIIRNIQDFTDKSYKCLEKTLRSCDLFQELTFRETYVSTANSRSKDFSYF